MQEVHTRDRCRLVRQLEELGRTRLSQHFFLRDFLHSEVAEVFGLMNIPRDPQLAVAAGSRLCEELLEPLRATFGDVRIRSGYRSPAVNALGNQHRLGCASNRRNYAGHIWDIPDQHGRIGASASIVVPWFVDRHTRGADWRSLAWWVHDHLPYSSMCFYPKLAAFNIQWREEPERRITSWAKPVGILTKPGMTNHEGCHSEWYRKFPELVDS